MATSHASSWLVLCAQTVLSADMTKQLRHMGICSGDLLWILNPATNPAFDAPPAATNSSGTANSSQQHPPLAATVSSTSNQQAAPDHMASKRPRAMPQVTPPSHSPTAPPQPLHASTAPTPAPAAAPAGLSAATQLDQPAASTSQSLGATDMDTDPPLSHAAHDQATLAGHPGQLDLDHDHVNAVMEAALGDLPTVSNMHMQHHAVSLVHSLVQPSVL